MTYEKFEQIQLKLVDTLHKYINELDNLKDKIRDSKWHKNSKIVITPNKLEVSYYELINIVNIICDENITKLFETSMSRTFNDNISLYRKKVLEICNQMEKIYVELLESDNIDKKFNIDEKLPLAMRSKIQQKDTEEELIKLGREILPKVPPLYQLEIENYTPPYSQLLKSFGDNKNIGINYKVLQHFKKPIQQSKMILNEIDNSLMSQYLEITEKIICANVSDNINIVEELYKSHKKIELDKSKIINKIFSILTQLDLQVNIPSDVVTYIMSFAENIEIAIRKLIDNFCDEISIKKQMKKIAYTELKMTLYILIDEYKFIISGFLNKKIDKKNLIYIINSNNRLKLERLFVDYMNEYFEEYPLIIPTNLKLISLIN